MKANKIFRSLGVGIMGVAMLAASAFPTFALTGHEDRPIPTKVSGKVTYPGGSWVSYANMSVTCYYIPYSYYNHSNPVYFNSDLYGQYSVTLPECNQGDAAYISVSIGNTSVHWYGINYSYVNNHQATVNVTVHQQ